MTNFVHKVALVVDPNFGEKLLPIANTMHVWAVGSAINMDAIQIWYERDLEQDLSFYRGASSFDYDEGAKPEKIASDIIETIDDHHGPNWTEENGEIPEWSCIFVYGCSLKDPILSTLMEYGIDDFEETAFGFIGKVSKR
ncbi:MAG: hypothetical protein GY705_19060 [Bacteroidetes bacterium]|nr:hypothetical protein [Bacteroidota bacterium]